MPNVKSISQRKVYFYCIEANKHSKQTCNGKKIIIYFEGLLFMFFKVRKKCHTSSRVHCTLCAIRRLLKRIFFQYFIDLVFVHCWISSMPSDAIFWPNFILVNWMAVSLVYWTRHWKYWLQINIWCDKIGYTQTTKKFARLNS